MKDVDSVRNIRNAISTLVEENLLRKLNNDQYNLTDYGLEFAFSNNPRYSHILTS